MQLILYCITQFFEVISKIAMIAKFSTTCKFERKDFSLYFDFLPNPIFDEHAGEISRKFFLDASP